jgi:hypothetical protein
MAAGQPHARTARRIGLHQLRLDHDCSHAEAGSERRVRLADGLGARRSGVARRGAGAGRRVARGSAGAKGGARCGQRLIPTARCPGGHAQPFPNPTDRALSHRTAEGRERLAELGGIGPAEVPVLGEAAQDGRRELGRHERVEPRRRHGLSLGQLHVELGQRLSAERLAPGERLVEDHAERPQIGACIDVARRAHLLGRHVDRRAHGHGGSGEPGGLAALTLRCSELRDAEVEHLEAGQSAAVLGDEQVGRLEIAVDDASGVRFGQRLERLHGVAHHLARRHRARASEHGAEIFAVEVLHHQIGLAAIEAPHLVDPHHVLALQSGRGASLAHEALDRLAALRHGRKQELDRPRRTELQVRGGDHHAHAAHSEDPLHAVGSREDVARVDSGCAARLHGEALGLGWREGQPDHGSIPLYTKATSAGGTSDPLLEGERSGR